MKNIVTLILAFIIIKGIAAQNVGVGTSTPSQKLDVNGNLKISGAIMPGGLAGTAGQLMVSNGNGVAPTWQSSISVTELQLLGNGAGLNKILTSDASGNASWSDPISFKGFQTTNTTIPHLVPDFALFNGEHFDDVNNLLPGHFTAPQTGTYHFDISVKWGSNTAVANYVETSLERCNNLMTNCVVIASSKMNDQFAAQQAFGVDVKLLVGERIRVAVYQTNTSFQSRTIEGVDGNGNIPTYFSGHLIR
jgi:hypothetical protein